VDDHHPIVPHASKPLLLLLTDSSLTVMAKSSKKRDAKRQQSAVSAQDGPAGTSTSPTINIAVKIKRKVVTPSAPLRALGQLLATVPRRPASSAVQGRAKLPSNPGLRVDGLGPVALPITNQDDAKRLIDVAEPIATGEKNPSAWRIPANKVRFGHPAWESGLAKLPKTLAHRFGFEDVLPTLALSHLQLNTVRAEESPRELAPVSSDQAFAKLQIHLSSVHRGGSLFVHQDGVEATVLSSPEREQDDVGTVCRYTAYGADLERSFAPLTHGYRLFAEYDVLWPTASVIPRPTFTLADELRSQLHHHLLEVAGTRQIFLHLAEGDCETPQLGRQGLQAFELADRNRFRGLLDGNEVARAVDMYIAEVALRVNSKQSEASEPAMHGAHPGGPQLRVVGIWTLDGRCIGRGREIQDLGIGPHNFISSSQVALTEQWAERVETLNQGAKHHKTTAAHTKMCIIGWSKQDNLRNLITALGKSATRELIRNPGPIEAEAMMELLTKSQGKTAEGIRHPLLDHLIDSPSLHHLLDRFFDVFPNIDNADNSPDVLLRLIRSAAWQIPSVKAKVFNNLRQNSKASTLFVHHCAKIGVPLSLWRAFLDETRPDLWKERHLMWRLALKLADPMLCEYMVTVLMDAQVGALASHLRAFDDMHRKHAILVAKHVAPLIDRFEELVKQQWHLLGVDPDKWRNEGIQYDGDSALRAFFVGRHHRILPHHLYRRGKP